MSDPVKPATPPVSPETQERLDRLAVAKAEVELAAAAAKVRADEATVRQAEIEALTPDLSKVTDSTLAVSGDAIGGHLLVHHALAEVATEIATSVSALGAGHRLLVTTEADLVATDAIYSDIRAALQALVEAATATLAQTDPDKPVGVSGRSASAVDLLAGLAAALPSVLSLLSAQRTLSTATVTGSDLAAVAATAQAVLKLTNGPVVVHDTFRLAPPVQGSAIYQQLGEVARNRSLLAGRQAQLTGVEDADQTELGRQRAGHTAAEAELKKLLETAAEDDPRARELNQQIEGFLREIDRLDGQLATTTVRLHFVRTLVESIDTYTVGLRAVAPGASRSPLVTAALAEALHEGTTRITHVLLVKTEAGQVVQLVSNRPLWWKDRVSIDCTVSVSYLCLDTADSALLAAGSVTRTATASGAIGAALSLEVRSITAPAAKAGNTTGTAPNPPGSADANPPALQSGLRPALPNQPAPGNGPPQQSPPANMHEWPPAR